MCVKNQRTLLKEKNPGSHEPAVCLCRLGEGRVSSLHFTESSNPSLDAEFCICYCKDINKHPIAGEMFPGQKIPTISDCSSTVLLTQRRKLLQTDISLNMCANPLSPGEEQTPFFRILSKHKISQDPTITNTRTNSNCQKFVSTTQYLKKCECHFSKSRSLEETTELKGTW